MQKKIQGFELSAGFHSACFRVGEMVSEEILGFQGLFSLRDFKEGELFNFNGLKRGKKIRSRVT